MVLVLLVLVLVVCGGPRMWNVHAHVYIYISHILQSPRFLVPVIGDSDRCCINHLLVSVYGH